MPKRLFNGKVVANKMRKTIVIAVDTPKKHRFYSKDMKIKKKLVARDEIGCIIGDLVTVEETRPLGKTVTWLVKTKLEEKK